MPIFSKQDVYEFLQKACDAFEIAAPNPSEILPITLHAPATQSIAHIKRLADIVRARQPGIYAKQFADRKANNESYFDIPVEHEALNPFNGTLHRRRFHYLRISSQLWRLSIMKKSTKR
jgi:hypothetical protein